MEVVQWEQTKSLLTMAKGKTGLSVRDSSLVISDLCELRCWVMGFWIGTSILTLKVTPLTLKTMHWLLHNESSKEMMLFFFTAYLNMFHHSSYYSSRSFQQIKKVKSSQSLRLNISWTACIHLLFPSSPTLFWCRWNERTGFNVHQAPWSQPNRPEENHWLYLHSQVVTQHGESAGHTGGSKLLTDPSCTGLLQSFSHIWGKESTQTAHYSLLYSFPLICRDRFLDALWLWLVMQTSQWSEVQNLFSTLWLPVRLVTRWTVKHNRCKHVRRVYIQIEASSWVLVRITEHEQRQWKIMCLL